MLSLQTNHAYQQRLAIAEGSENKLVADMNRGFSDDEVGVLQKYQLPLPSDVFLDNMKDSGYVKQILDNSSKINRKLGQQKGALSTTKKARLDNRSKIDQYNKEIEAIQKYRKRVGVIEEGSKTLKSGR